jgi:hypothetical protein
VKTAPAAGERDSDIWIWNLGWLALIVTIASGVWHNRPLEVIADWPNGTSADADFWHGGVFLEHRADRIHRIAIYRGERVETHSIRFFASIPMTEPELQCGILESRKFRNRNPNLESPVHPRRPEWFPLQKYQIGIFEEHSSNWLLFVRPGDDHLYITR